MNGRPVSFNIRYCSGEDSLNYYSRDFDWLREQPFIPREFRLPVSIPVRVRRAMIGLYDIFRPQSDFGLLIGVM